MTGNSFLNLIEVSRERAPAGHQRANGKPENTDKSPEIVGSHGDLPSKKTKAILGRLKREAGPKASVFFQIKGK
jgi:hypothetical protein